LEIQQQKLLQLRQEMQERLERQRLALEQQLAYQQQQMSAELAKKEEKKEEKDTRSEESQLTLWQKGGIIVFLILGGLACVANLVLILFYSTPAHRDNSLAVEGAALLIFGGFYLAYDLLGGRNGPLVRFTAYVTYALIGALGASIASVLLLAQDLTIIPLATRFKNFDIDPARTAGLSSTNLIIDTHSALFCLFWGAIIGISGKLLIREYKQHVPLAWLGRYTRELFWCLLFWAFFLSMLFPVVFPGQPGTLTASAALLILYLPVIIPILLMIGLARFVSRRLPTLKESHRERYWALLILSILLFCFLTLLPVFVVITRFVPLFRGMGAVDSALVLGLLVGPVLFLFFLVRLYRFLIIHKLLGIKTGHPRRYWTIFVPSTLIVYLFIGTFPTISIAPFVFQQPLSAASTLVSVLAMLFGFALSGTITTIIAPFTVDWIKSQEEKRLATIGLAIVTVGTIVGALKDLLGLLH